MINYFDGKAPTVEDVLNMVDEEIAKAMGEPDSEEAYGKVFVTESNLDWSGNGIMLTLKDGSKFRISVDKV